MNIHASAFVLESCVCKGGEEAGPRARKASATSAPVVRGPVMAPEAGHDQH